MYSAQIRQKSDSRALGKTAIDRCREGGNPPRSKRGKGALDRHLKALEARVQKLEAREKEFERAVESMREFLAEFLGTSGRRPPIDVEAGPPVPISPQFLPTSDTARLAVAALAADRPRLDVTASYLPAPDSPVSLERVRALLGEQVLSLLGIASEYFAPSEGIHEEPVVDSRGRLSEDLKDNLGDLLGLDRASSAYGPFMRAIGADLCRWAQEEPDLLRTIGGFLTPDGSVKLNCKSSQGDPDPDISDLPAAEEEVDFLKR